MKSECFFELSIFTRDITVQKNIKTLFRQFKSFEQFAYKAASILLLLTFESKGGIFEHKSARSSDLLSITDYELTTTSSLVKTDFRYVRIKLTTCFC